MRPDIRSRLALQKLFSEFDDAKNGLSNKDYLEFQIGKLERARTAYETNSRDARQKPRDRARARDYAYSLAGIIAGIKFSISFMEHKDSDLIKLEGLEPIREVNKQ